MTKHTLLNGPSLTILALVALSAPAAAQTALPEVTVDTATDPAAPDASVDANALKARRAATSDTASLLSDVPGVSLNTNGGISSLPSIHGLADDRIKTTVDGVPITGFCPNHMNPALSYVDPAQVDEAQVWAGITPVSQGGDSIAGSIAVTTRQPTFATPDEGLHTSGHLSTFYRSINRSIGGSVGAEAATQSVSLGYDGSWDRARDSHDAEGNRLRSTLYETQSHAITAAVRGDDTLVTVKAGHQITPYEGFSNQRMDLTGNQTNYLNADYQGDYGWGRGELKVYWQNVRHSMDFLSEKLGMMHMPMNTDGTDLGYSGKLEFAVSHDDTLRVGNEWHHYRLNDWWPPVAGAYPSMGNNTFANINDGHRDQIGTFGEWQHQWESQWTSLIGLRNDIVSMNTGRVAGYSDCNGTGANCNAASGNLNYARDAAAFNALDHAKTDVNYDLTAQLKHDSDQTRTEEFGLSRKTRSPNLYERYAWSTGGMASSMVNWYGDGNEYVGNLNLKPETAYTASTSVGWHDAARQDWEIKATPYYTYIQDYIGVNQIGYDSSRKVPQLQFANHDAQIYGVDLSGKRVLMRDEDWGKVAVNGTAGWMQGGQMNGNSLYHMMPLNARVSLTHQLGGWDSALELRGVGAKGQADPLRAEPHTPGFVVANLRTGYEWTNLRLDLGIENLFNKQYYEPLAGVDYADWKANGSHGSLPALAAAGRSFTAGMTVKF